MDWYATVFELIDMRSFSNLWYWIALAVFWSTTSHWVLGVPYDMIQRAGRHGGEAQADLEDMVRINCNRFVYVAEMSGIWLLGFVCAILSSLAVLAVYYRVEFAQAVLLLTFPMTIIGFLSLRTVGIIRQKQLNGEALRRQMYRHRIITQVIGMISIFITAMWGMYQNLSLGVLGG